MLFLAACLDVVQSVVSFSDEFEEYLSYVGAGLWIAVQLNNMYTTVSDMLKNSDRYWEAVKRNERVLPKLETDCIVFPSERTSLFRLNSGEIMDLNDPQLNNGPRARSMGVDMLGLLAQMSVAGKFFNDSSQGRSILTHFYFAFAIPQKVLALANNLYSRFR